MTTGDYDDEMEHVFDEVTRPRPDYDDVDDDPPLQPLCTRCVQDPPADDSGVCQFCKVIKP